MSSTRLVVGPFKRPDGDLEVRLDVADGRVEKAQVTTPASRGIEARLVGQAPRDAMALLPRLAVVGSVATSAAAARAIGGAAGLVPPPNGERAVELMLGVETVAEHLSFFYLFFMPDLMRPAYAARPWFATVERQFASLAGEQSRKAIAARQRWVEMLALLGGRWPHATALGPGGSTHAVGVADRPRLQAKLRELRGFLERELFAAPLEEVLALDSLAALERWRAEAPGSGDLRLWLTVALDAGLASLGRGPGRLLNVGAAAPGLWHRGTLQPLNTDALTEEVTQAWLHAGHETTQMLGGKPVEVGAIARLAAAGQPLLRDALLRLGSNVHTRVLARLIELAALPAQLERALAALRPGEPFSAGEARAAAGEGVGLVEGARGALGHWLQVERGRIAHCRIVAPAQWNRLPLQAALEGAPVAPGDTAPAAVQHVVRSFDP